MNGVLTICSIIGKVRGVDNYVVVDDQGNILAHDMESPETLSRLVHLWGQSLSTLGGEKFKYASLSRTRNRDLLMFPVGNYFLGVVRQTGMDNTQSAESVVEIFARHSDRSV